MSRVATSSLSAGVPGPPRLLDQVRSVADARFARDEPGERYAQWVRRFMLFHGLRRALRMRH